MRRLPPLLFAVIALAAVPAAAQAPAHQRAELRLRELQAQISHFEQQLATTRREESSATEALTSIDREIAVREALVDSYARRLIELNTEAASIESELAEGEREIRQLREEYGAYARHAYVRGRIGDLALVLSAGSINQMLVRARYLQRFSRQRQRKAQQIAQKQEDLAARRVRLDSTAVSVNAMLAESRQEQQQLAGRKRERAQLVTDLRRRSTGLQAEVRRRQQEASQLQTQIQRFIAEADRGRAAEAARPAEAPARAEAAAPAAAAPRPMAPAPVAEVSEAEFARLSGSFRQNRGRLPWPASGVVAEPFGPRRNEVTGTVISNPGLVLTTSPLTPVRAVFGGAVSRVFVMPGYGTCVLVSHGDFSTVYGNLSGVNVQQGQRVEPGAVVGRAGGPDQPLGAGVFFGVFEKGAPVNPGAWLQSRG